MISLAMVMGMLGCQRPPPPVPPAEKGTPDLQMSEKDEPSSAAADEGEDPDAIAVELNDEDHDGSFARELQELDEAEPEVFAFNSIEGVHDGVATAARLPAESMEDTLARLRKDPRVKVAEPVVSVHADFVPNDPQYASQWNLKQIHMEQAWDITQGEGAVVAVIDTGIAYENYGEFKQVPDLAGVKFVPGYDFVNDTEHANDDNSHGTHVAGTIAQATNNGEGVAGIAFRATLMPVKVLDADGYGNSVDIADAIHWAADHGAKVINMSLGGGGASKLMADSVAYARKKGVVVVCAAGNAGRGVVEYPAAYPGAVAVSSVGPQGNLAPYSSYGKEIDIAAPGGDKSQGEQAGILQQTIDPSDPSKAVYAYFQGTSMATPHVAGVAALLWSAGAKSPDEVEKALFAGAKARGQAWNNKFGHGLLDAAASLKALKAGTDVAEPVRTPAPTLTPRATTKESVLKVVLGVLLAIGTAATIRQRNRNPLGPALLVALTLAAAGLFFIPAPESSAMFDGVGIVKKVIAYILSLIEIPIPDWGEWFFGPGKASPLFYSALIPLIASIIGYAAKGTRQIMGGLCFGFASLLAYSAWAGTPALAWMPLRVIAVPYLLTNVVVCLFLGRALIRKTEGS
jgi:serine protease